MSGRARTEIRPSQRRRGSRPPSRSTNSRKRLRPRSFAARSRRTPTPASTASTTMPPAAPSRSTRPPCPSAATRCHATATISTWMASSSISTGWNDLPQVCADLRRWRALLLRHQQPQRHHQRFALDHPAPRLGRQCAGHPRPVADAARYGSTRLSTPSPGACRSRGTISDASSVAGECRPAARR